MASGKAHTRATWIIALPVATAAAFLSVLYTPHTEPQTLLFTLSAFAGVLLTLYVNPDQDQEGMVRIEYKMVRATLGLSFALLWFWGFYAVVIPHRHWSSHLPVVGTLIRYVYMRGLSSIWISFLLERPLAFYPALHPVADLGLLCGMLVSDFVHWLMDGFPIRG